jgi:DNA-binding IclR family transcriptional regulator
MSSGEIENEDDDRLGIQSVEIAAAIVRAMVTGGGLMQLRELSAATGMHRGKVHRYLTSLTRCRLLYQDENTGAYGIGPLSITLGLTGLRSLDPVRIALREIPAFAELVNETIVASIWGDMGPTVIAIQESRRPITLNVRAGSILPIRLSAAGQVFEAFLPETVVAAVLNCDPGSKIHAKGHKRRVPLSQVRAHKMAYVEGDLIPGINAVAAPVFNHLGNLCLVIGMLGQKETLDVSWNSRNSKLLISFVEQLSAELGHKSVAGGAS